MYCSNIIKQYLCTPVLHEYLDGDDDKIEEIKMDIFHRFGDHIPTLKKEFRDKRLERILSYLVLPAFGLPLLASETPNIL